MNADRAIGAVRRGDEAQAAALFLGLESLLLVLRRDAGDVRLDPDLQEVHRLRLRVVELAVHDAAPGAHALHVALADDGARARGVLVRQLAVEHVADDLHVPVAMRAEAGTRDHAVLVDDAQRPELHVLRIPVVGE